VAVNWNPRIKQRLWQIDRACYWKGPYRGTRLDLEIDAVTRRLLIMRMVRRGWRHDGKPIDCLGDFRFALVKSERCTPCYNDHAQAYVLRHVRPNLDPRDAAVVDAPICPRMLRRLVGRSSVILLSGVDTVHEFPGLTERGRLIVRCQGKGRL